MLEKIKIKQIGVLLLVNIQFLTHLFGNERQEIQNLRAFTKLFGYVRYFHPSDEANKINWNKFAIYGIKHVKHAEDSNGLKDILDSLFLPIAPAIQIYFNGKQLPIKPSQAVLKDSTKLKIVAWQHLGVWLSPESNIYRSIRLNRENTSYSLPGQLFDKYPKIGELIKKELDAGLSCQIPLSLYSDSIATLGNDAKYSFKSLLAQLNTIVLDSITANNEYVRLGDIIVTWNIFQHFYPYFDEVNVDWDKTLTETLKEAIEIDNQNDFYDTLRKMIAQLQDGHGVVYFKHDSPHGGLPIRTEWIENQVVITASNDTSLFKKGDIIQSIDGIDGESALLNAEKFVSGSPQLRRYRALNQFGGGPLNSIAKLELIRDFKSLKVEIKRDIETRNLFFNSVMEFDYPAIKKYNNGIYYINLRKIDLENFDKIIGEIENAKGVIYDYRWGGNNKFSIGKIIPHLINEPVQSPRWNIPQIIYPDRMDIIYYESRWSIEPQGPYFKSKNVFIVDAPIVSSGETFMGIIEHYKLGEIVGKPTAGCNGNANFIPLPGDYLIMWTGMKVLKHDSTQHHLIGIQPTFHVLRTIQAVKDGRDEFLEKAMEVINQ